MSTHVCPCPNPPGGSVSCRPDQLAYCAIENGELRSGCVDVSAAAAIALQKLYVHSGLPTPEFLCWVFGAVTERPMDRATLEPELRKLGIQSLEDEKLLPLLKAGKISLFGRQIHFRLPQKVEVLATATAAA